MLAIRLQRQGRKGYATYRFIVQDAKLSPDSGRVVARIGSYNPHSKEIKLDKEKAKFYLDNGAQPSDSIVRIFKSQKVNIPSWVEAPTKQKREIKNPQKLRKNQPKDEKKPAEEPKQEEEQASEEPKDEEKPTKEAPQDQKEEAKEPKPEEDDKPQEESKPEESQGEEKSEKASGNEDDKKESEEESKPE